MANFDHSIFSALRFEQEFGGYKKLDQSESSIVLRVEEALSTLVWIDYFLVLAHLLTVWILLHTKT